MNFIKKIKGNLKLLILISTLSTPLINCQLLNSNLKNSPKDIYRYMQHKMLDWQERTKREKWSTHLVDEIMAKCVEISSYEDEIINMDFWKTYNEFIKDNFRGDCEDIAAFMFGTLKRLDYPYDVRMIGIIINSNRYHVALKVELPDGKWVVYDSVSQFKIRNYISFGEWDENKTYKP